MQKDLTTFEIGPTIRGNKGIGRTNLFGCNP